MNKYQSRDIQLTEWLSSCISW